MVAMASYTTGTSTFVGMSSVPAKVFTAVSGKTVVGVTIASGVITPGLGKLIEEVPPLVSPTFGTISGIFETALTTGVVEVTGATTGAFICPTAATLGNPCFVEVSAEDYAFSRGVGKA
jgi:hypothetical protein